MRRALTALALLLACGEARAAKPDAIEACATAATAGQKLQRQGKLRDARASFLACVKPECPGEVRSVCERFLSSVDASLPTIVLGARDAEGHDLLAVRVLVDDAPFAESLDGKALAIDPGPHSVRFERAEGGPSETVNVVVRETEKNRTIAIAFPAEKAAPPPAPAPEPKKDEERPPPPAGAYVLGGLGALALGGFGYLTLHGQSVYDDCHTHGCSQSTIDSLSLQRAIAFVALGVGVVAVGGATYLFLARPTKRGVEVGASGARLIF